MLLLLLPIQAIVVSTPTPAVAVSANLTTVALIAALPSLPSHLLNAPALLILTGVVLILIVNFLADTSKFELLGCRGDLI